ncbi:RDD family protein [Cellulomonas sp. ATA003]|uniref:RDD family protein n=1 Tax=Cellulomonas sp. ATA003 TaxID=3073064 RepID=UPI0028732E51|nr:RDD family protein [Cellulomonas sp. ATA003]WNB84489.1 RDD family protein [Cellulomonas sp. ATA003]
MATREDMGSWLEGGRPGDPDRPDGLGLPRSGPGSRAGLGRRVVALAVDWLLCLAISAAFFDAAPMATLAVFAVENVLLVGTTGTTIGHRLLGVGVRTLPAARGAASRVAAAVPPPGIVRAAVRTVLLCLVIPAVVWDSDGRGLHDRGAGTVIVRR